MVFDVSQISYRELWDEDNDMQHRAARQEAIVENLIRFLEQKQADLFPCVLQKLGIASVESRIGYQRDVSEAIFQVEKGERSL